MVLFGRRKPGFSKEVELRPEDISDSFSDRNDPAMIRNDNPKTEKLQWATRAKKILDTAAPAAPEALDVPKAPPASEKQPASAAPVLAEDPAQKAAAEGKTIDLFDSLDTLPEVEDPFPPSVPEDPAPEKPAPKPAEMLAEYIRERSKAAQLTSRKALEKEEPSLDTMLEKMKSIESCADIRSVKGSKDEYFYSEEHMANNYAMIASLVAEKDIPSTLAQMTRFNCKTYPSPTPLAYFQRHPYYYTRPQLQYALTVLQKNPDYADVKTLVTESNHVTYLYSEKHMSLKYARALAEGVESGEADG